MGSGGNNGFWQVRSTGETFLFWLIFNFIAEATQLPPSRPTHVAAAWGGASSAPSLPSLTSPPTVTEPRPRLAGGGGSEGGADTVTPPAWPVVVRDRHVAGSARVSSGYCAILIYDLQWSGQGGAAATMQGISSTFNSSNHIAMLTTHFLKTNCNETACT